MVASAVEPPEQIVRPRTLHVVLLCAALVTLGVGLMTWTGVQVGAPWGFRDSVALVKELLGGVEIHEGVDGARIPTVGMGLSAGAQVRTSTYAQANIVMPHASVIVEDRAAVTFGGPQADIVVELGRARILIAGSDKPIRVATKGNDVALQLGQGRFVVGTDGKGQLIAVVVAGRLFVQEGKALPEAVQEQRLLVSVPDMPIIVSEMTQEVPLSVSIVTEAGELLPNVVGRIPPGARVYVNGEVTYPDATGKFSLQLVPGTEPVVVVAEDLLGNTSRQVLKRPLAKQ